MSRNAYFYYIKSTFFDIITYYFKSYDSTKTNNTSFECPVSGPKILEEHICSSFWNCHATFLVKKTLFKGEVAWQPLKVLQICSSSILDPPTRAFKWGIVCLSTIITFKNLSSNVKKCPFLLYKIYIFWYNYSYFQKLW